MGGGMSALVYLPEYKRQHSLPVTLRESLSLKQQCAEGN